MDLESTLSALHVEIEDLKRQNAALVFKLTMSSEEETLLGDLRLEEEQELMVNKMHEMKEENSGLKKKMADLVSELSAATARAKELGVLLAEKEEAISTPPACQRKLPEAPGSPPRAAVQPSPPSRESGSERPSSSPIRLRVAKARAAASDSPAAGKAQVRRLPHTPPSSSLRARDHERMLKDVISFNLLQQERSPEPPGTSPRAVLPPIGAE